MRATLLTAAACAAIATSAFAQAAPPAAAAAAAAPDDEQQIVVTGSRIPRPTYDRSQPTLTLTGDTIDKRAFTSLGQALNDLPGFGVADSSLIGNQGNGFGVGQSFVNLYSLGSQRTLTLVNGRRFVGANPASVFSSAGAGTQVDLNVIPTNLIDRIETVGIGGAPIYGADAIAGTVNLILKKKYRGIELNAESGISARGDLPTYRFRGLGGVDFADHRGNIMVSAEYVNESGIIGNERDVINAQRGFVAPTVAGDPYSVDTNSPFSKVLVSNQRTFLGVPGGNPYFLDRGTLDRPSLGPRSVRDLSGNLVRFGPNGDLIPFNTGTPTSDPTTFLGGDALNFADITNLKVDSERINTAAFATFDFTDHIKAFGEGWYSKNRATNLAGQPVYNTGFFRQAAPGAFDVNGNYIFRLDNPFLTTQARNTLRQSLIANNKYSGTDADSIFYVGRANTDLVQGVARLDQDLYRLVGGFNGDFTLAGRKLNWEVFGSYGRTRSESIQPSLVEPNLRRALNVTRDASGNIVCAPFNPDPNDPTQPPLVRTDPNTPPFDQPYNGTRSTTCAPLNLFGNGAPSQAARDYVTTDARTVATTIQRDIGANLTGTVFKLPGGDLGFSLGYENRREISRFRPDDYYTTPFGRTIPILGLSGSYITNEGSVELLAPIIGPDQHIPLVRSLELNGAARYVENSVAGGDFTWTAGGRWSPIRDLSIRGNFTRAIRAPAVTELFAANQPAFDGGFDPCDSQNVTSGPAVRAVNCAKAGLPANFSSLINSVTVPITVIGNKGLRNEKSNSWTVGAVLQPRFIRRFSISVDYISIDLQDPIISSGAADVLRGCYDASTYPNNYYCGLFTRDTSPDNLGQILTLQEPYINQGSRAFRALQSSLDWQVDLPRNLGRLSLGANWEHIIKQYRVIAPGSDPTQERGGIGTSVDQANFRATYTKNAFEWFNEVRFIGGASFDATEPAGTRNIPGVGDYIVWNMSAAIQVAKRARFQVNVDNVTDRSLPYPAASSASQNFYPEGIFGRSFTASIFVKY